MAGAKMEVWQVWQVWQTRREVTRMESTHRDEVKQLEARLEHGLQVLQAATGCSDSEAERLLSHWDVVNLEYDAAVQNDKTELDAT